MVEAAEESTPLRTQNISCRGPSILCGDRALGKRGQHLRVSRHGGETTYFITSENNVVEFDIKLEDWGRKLGCLNPWEMLVTKL